MPEKLADKDNVDAVEFSTDQWDRTTGPDGERTYTATADGASATVRFRPPQVDQQHTGCKAGSKFTRHKDGSWSITHKT